MVVDIKRYIELISEKGNSYIIEKKDKEMTLSLTEGKIILPADLRLPAIIETSANVKILIKKPYFNTLFAKKFKRKAQIIHEKDLSYILKKYYVGKEAKVLEAGGGSGHATIYLAQLYDKITTLEKRKDFYEIIKENLKTFSIANVELINQDFYEYTSPHQYDLIILDFKTAHTYEALSKAKELLTLGGYVVIYLPVIEQVRNAIKNLKMLSYLNIEVKEIMLRDWHVEPLRPEFKMLGHTAFIVSARRF